jgi:LytS/YehU family sensor histidine kinase
VIVAMPVTLAIVATYNLAPRMGWVRYAAIAMALVVSAAAGVAAALAMDAGLDCGVDCFVQSAKEGFIQAWIRYGSLCALFTVVFIYLRDADESVARALDADRERALFVQRMEEARLRMLQAQIEPHFLFNTLANVRRLYQAAPADGTKMLDNLMRYFAVALPQMRAADSTIGREADLTASYLGIQQIRMGRRLVFDLDIPAALRSARLPPMMLLTLVENSIKHGLAPLREGGTVTVSAVVSGDELRVRVADSGGGFTKSSGAGTGLANIRARLASMHGSGGRLTLAANAPRGVVATIAVPLSLTPPAAATS